MKANAFGHIAIACTSAFFIFLAAVCARADAVTNTVFTDPFDSSRGTLILTNDAIIDPINAFRTNGGFEDGHTLMRNGGPGSVSFIEFQTGCRASIEGVRLFAGNDGAANSFRRSLSRFQLWADLDDNGSCETLVVDTGTVNQDYSTQPGNASADPQILDLTLTNISGGVISAQHWRFETTQGSDVQPSEGARIIEVDALPPRISVTNTNDSGAGSLRQAILDANGYPCPDTITFNIPGPGPHLIQPLAPLPQVTAPVSLDARTQPGYTGAPLIQLRGDPVTNYNGLEIVSSNCVVAGLAFTHFTNGGTALTIAGPNAAWNWIHGNYFGLDPTGTNVAFNHVGIGLGGGTHHNLIGTDGDGVNDAAERNLISGNFYGFVWYDAHSNRVAGNYIGTDVSGTLARGNIDGFYIDGSATANVIGTDSSNDPFNANERNVISGNGRGILLHGANRASGNFIGTDPSGAFAVPNEFGLQVTGVGPLLGSDGDGVRDNEERNVISGNSLAGMIVGGPSTREVVIRGNYIGTDASGTLAVPNGSGISLHNQPNHMLITGNVISGNTFFGVVAGNGPYSNSITANFIGVDASGANALGNGDAGVYLVDGSWANTIGGTNVAARNVISGNGNYGIVISGAGTSNNAVIGNFIGTDAGGTLALPNNFGITLLNQVTSTLIHANVISGNTIHGLDITDGSSGTVARGNLFGTDRTGMADLGNGAAGVVIGDAPANVIGGTAVADRNVISGNQSDGVVIHGEQASANQLLGNFIGTDITGTNRLGNAFQGVVVFNAPSNSIGAALAGGGNVVSANGNGIVIDGTNSVFNQVLGNLIGTDVSGTADLGNRNIGVVINDGANNSIGSAAPGARNVISGNDGEGVGLGLNSHSNIVAGNFIGMDINGTAALGNNNGISIYFSGGANVVGLAVGGGGNLISGNAASGIFMAGPAPGGNVVQNNLIGTDVTGSLDFGNGQSGIYVFEVPGNRLGGNSPNTRNIVSGNGAEGVKIEGPSAVNNQLHGNFIGTDASGTSALRNAFQGVWIGNAGSNVIGGATPGAGNLISGNGGRGVLIFGTNSSFNHVLGNLIGTDVSGEMPLGNRDDGIQIGQAASANLIGGTAPGSGNIIAANNGSGVRIETGAAGNTIQGNFIGTSTSSAAGLGNGTSGLSVTTPNNLIGGATAGAANVISGNTNAGVHLYPGADFNQILGNYIGTNPSGTAAVSNLNHGVWVEGGSSNRIGGTVAGEGNVIAFNGGDGVFVQSAASRSDVILGNAIFANAGLGIDLAPNGPTPNDPSDGDTGPNNLQNFPALTAATTDTNTVVTGSLPGPANGPYLLQFFVSVSPDPSGFGEGGQLVGSLSLPSGGSSFTATLAGVVPVGQSITATATDPAGNTSEFSPAEQVTPAAPVITGQPNGGARTCGSIFALIVIATGREPLSYQWFQGSTPVAAATNRTLVRTTSPATAGDYTVEVSNAYGSVTSVLVTVTYVDTVPPVIACASNFVAEFGTAWDFTPPTVTDACEGTNVTVEIVNMATNGVACPAKFTVTRTWRATDPSTNSSTCSQTVTVVDTTPPVIACQPDRIVECSVAWSFDTPTAADIRDGTNVTITVVGTTTNQLIGQTFRATRTWRATDSCTNSSECSQTITIVDTTPPSIVCSTNITVECEGPAGTRVFFASGANDACDTNVPATCTPPSGSIFTLGSQAVNCSAMDDSGNTNQCTFTVTVRDTTRPLITCPANIIAAENPRDSGGAVVTFAAPVTSDICDSALNVSCTPPSGTTFSVGFTTVTCVARDDSGNSNTCAFSIRVIPYRLPVTTVSNTNDSGPGSLRQAMLDANDGPGENLILFNLPPGPHTIHLLSALPVISSPVIIDGWSQPGFGGAPLVALDGSGAGGVDGLVITVGSSLVRGLILNGFETGIRLESVGTNVIQGNYIGTDFTGTNRVGNSGDGVFVGSARNLIGGVTPGAGNVISGNGGNGIHVTGAAASRNRVQGNWIGTGSDALTPLGNGANGVLLGSGVFGTSIGGPTNGSANLIAFNAVNGVMLEPGAGTANAIIANPIFDNGALGIDLNADGVTLNDAGDADVGPNALQNFPLLTDTRSIRGVTEIDGFLSGATTGVFRVDFFLNDVADSSGHGEGQAYIGSTTVLLADAAPVNFFASFPLTAIHTQFVTATATDPLGNTSEFSPAVQVRTPPIFETMPVSTNATPGEPVTFCVMVTGTPPFTYQWRHNGVNMPGETNACLSLPSVDVADGGSYSVVVANELDAVFTGQAPLFLNLTNVAPVADNFADRVPLLGTSGVTAGQNIYATFENGEPFHAGKFGGKSVWYTWRAPVTGIATFETRGSTFDTLLAVYTGTSFSNLVTVASDEDRGGFYTSGVRFNAIRGVQYHIAIDGFGGAEGTFLLGWEEKDTPHLLAFIRTQPESQTVAPGAEVTFSVDAVRVCGHGHQDCPDPGEFPDGILPLLTFQWFFNGDPIEGATSPQLTMMNLQAEHVGEYTVQVTVQAQTHARTIESQAASLQINLTGDSVQNVMATDKFLDTANAPASIILGGGTSFPARVGGPQAGSVAASAVVRGYTGSQVFNTAGSATEAGEEPICGVMGGASQWISFVALESGKLHLNTDGSSYDTVVAVFVRSPTNATKLQLLKCDNNSGRDGRDSKLDVDVQVGKTNFIVIDGVNSATGVLQLNYSLVTPTTLTSLGTGAQGAYRLRVNGHAAMRFTIQSSTDFVNWTSLFTTNSLTSSFDFSDFGAGTNSRRYYRALMIP